MPALRQVLLERLHEQPVAVICDLYGLRAVDPACVTLFSSVVNHPSSRWPETNLLLCCARPAVSAVLDRLRMPLFLPVHPTVEAALAQAIARPSYPRDELSLAPSPTAPAAARRFVLVRDTCRQWRLDAIDGPNDPMARLWAEDLVDRAIW